MLAAGASQRLGMPKQLLRIEGETLIHRAARMAVENNFAPVCVVIGSNASLMRDALADTNIMVVENQAWETGMSSSLRMGIAHLAEQNPGIRHLLVMVCDQIQLSAEVLQLLRKQSTTNPDCIIASRYADKCGVPAIFPAVYFNDLSAIQGDRGARLVMEQFHQHVITVEFPEGIVDIDTIKDAREAGLT